MGGRTQRPVAGLAAFWDASALVPLCVQQSNTAAAITAYDVYSVVVWWATPVEITSALARLLRMRQLTLTQWARVRKLSSDLAGSWSVIQPTEMVRTKALQIVERFDLRAADALQLSAASEWCSDSPKSHTFLTADDRLLEAALLSGFNARRI